VGRLSDRAFTRFAVFLIVVASTGLFALLQAQRGFHFTPDGLRDWVRGYGVWAPVVFTGAFVLRPFIFFPSTLLFLAGGLAFGVAWGTLYAAIGGTAGAVIGFAIARALGREFVEVWIGVRIPEERRDRWGAGLVLLLNLIPVVPMTAINYGAGLSGMGIGPFTLAVIAGLTPRAFAYSFFGHSLLHIGALEFRVGLVFLTALVVIPLYVRRRLASRIADASAVEGP
jgi:uncharacterized membrane protein YdjX (TVP38/TMEM64 family)